jgi:hypothetical protein
MSIVTAHIPCLAALHELPMAKTFKLRHGFILNSKKFTQAESARAWQFLGA